MIFYNWSKFQLIIIQPENTQDELELLYEMELRGLDSMEVDYNYMSIRLEMPLSRSIECS